MQTWKVDKPQQRQFAIAAFVVQLLMMAVMIALIVWRDTGWIFAIVIAASLVPSFLAWQQTRMSTSAGDEGIDIYDGFRTRHLPWSQVDAVGKHERYDHIVAVRHTDGSDVVLPGVHAKDVPELRHLVADHR